MSRHPWLLWVTLLALIVFVWSSVNLGAWLPDGYSRIFRSYLFGPLGFWTMAPLRYVLPRLGPSLREWLLLSFHALNPPFSPGCTVADQKGSKYIYENFSSEAKNEERNKMIHKTQMPS